MNALALCVVGAFVIYMLAVIGWALTHDKRIGGE